MNERINSYRLKTSPFVRSNSDTRDIFPLIIISCEGTRTEYQYFNGLANAIKERKYQHTDIVLRILPLPKSDTNSDPQSVFDLLDEFWEKHGDEYDNPIMAAVIDRDDHNCNATIQYCREHMPFQIQLFLSSPCFEFFLLLHICDNIADAYDMEKIKLNERISNAHTYMSSLIAELTHSRKDIDFERDYLDNIPRALVNAFKFETNILQIGDSIGTNLPDFFDILNGVKQSVWE